MSCSEPLSKPILKNGPSSQLKPAAKRLTEVQRLTVINREMDMFVKQQEASRQFFNHFTDRLKQSERQKKEKLAASPKCPHHYTYEVVVSLVVTKLA